MEKNKQLHEPCTLKQRCKTHFHSRATYCTAQFDLMWAGSLKRWKEGGKKKRNEKETGKKDGRKEAGREERYDGWTE